MPYDRRLCRTRTSTLTGKGTDVRLIFEDQGVSCAWKGRELGGSTDWTVIETCTEVFNHKAISDGDAVLDFDAMRDVRYIMVPTFVMAMMGYTNFCAPRPAVPGSGPCSPAPLTVMTFCNIGSGVWYGFIAVQDPAAFYFFVLIVLHWIKFYADFEYPHGAWIGYLMWWT